MNHNTLEKLSYSTFINKLIKIIFISLFIFISYAKAETSVSEYQRLLDRQELVNRIKEKSHLVHNEIIEHAIIPEVLSEQEVEKRLDVFQHSFYINTYKYNHGDGLEVGYSTFKTVDNSQNNMAVGFRWLKAITEQGKNIIDPLSIQKPENVSLYYINHDNGITSQLSLFGTNVKVNDSPIVTPLSYVSGEALVSYFPGFEKISITANDINKTKTLNDITVNVESFNKSYMQLNFDYKTLRKHHIYGYNKKGELIEISSLANTFLFEGEKTINDYTGETYPGINKAARMRAYVLFDGEIDKVELYFKKPMVNRIIPIKALPMLSENMKIDDFKTIVDSVSYEPQKINDFINKSITDLQDETVIRFDRSESLVGFNEPELKVHLPRIPNSQYSESHFKNLSLKKTLSGKYIPLRFYTRVNGVISTFKLLVMDAQGVEHEEEADLNTGITSVRGIVNVKYPVDIEWIKAGIDVREPLNDVHKITIEGGLVHYFPPKNYEMPNVRLGSHAGKIIHAYNKAGRELSLQTRVFDHTEAGGYKYGFWGNVDHVEIMVINKWDNYEQHFEALVTPKLLSEETFGDFGLGLASAMLEPDAMKKLKDEYEKSLVNKKSKITPMIEYKIIVGANIKQEKPIKFVWHGVLPSVTAFSDANIYRLLTETNEQLKRAVSYHYKTPREGKLSVRFYQLANGKVVKSYTENEFYKLINRNKSATKLINNIKQTKMHW